MYAHSLQVEAALHDELQRVRREVRLVQALQKEQQQRRRDAIAAMQSLQTSRAATALSATGGPEASQVTIATANGVVPSVDAVGNRSNSGDNTADSSPRRSDPHSGHDKSPGIPRVTAGSTSAGAISSVGGLPSNTGSAGKPPPYDGPPALLVVPQTAQADGAFCLDSTPAGYYFRPGVGKNASKWVLFLEGGGWCYSNITCIERRTRWFSMGSMKGRFADSRGIAFMCSP